MKILIVDDEPLARARLRALVGELALPGVEVAAEARRSTRYCSTSRCRAWMVSKRRGIWPRSSIRPR